MKQAISIRGKTITLEELKALPEDPRYFWTPEEEELLREACRLHKTARGIAGLLGRTEHAVRQKMQCMGLCTRMKRHA
jgi:hypothetical protein